MINRSAGREIGDAEWAVLVGRGMSDDLYGVVTTGVVCRHGCPARTPLRQNVRVFATVKAATDAGFRACKRCKPMAATPESSQST
jgi:AraC family transcriptional regulator, regulatory protein of adaptative response / methylated-DNA-[protein]-cysteine methyltransferase